MRQITKAELKELTGYNWKELKEAFAAVMNPEDWRGPVDSRGILAEDLPVTIAAIDFYHGSLPHSIFLEGRSSDGFPLYRILAQGQGHCYEVPLGFTGMPIDAY